MYKAIALGAHKGGGKDLIAAYLEATRENVAIRRSKTPVVKAFEASTGHPYDKSQDDALMRFSREIARKENPAIVADWLRAIVRADVMAGLLPVIPDMRFPKDNEALLSEDALCLKIHASEETCRQRVLARDRTIAHYQPDDPTEYFIDELEYHHVIDNDRDDGGQWAILQLEKFLSRPDVCLARNKRLADSQRLPSRVRIIDPTSPFFWETGRVQPPTEQQAKQFSIHLEISNRVEVFPANAFVPTSVFD